MKEYNCPFCDNTFKRADFALRHIAQVHASNNAFNCSYCQAGFARRDALTRHAKTCRAGPGGAELQPMKKACTLCERLRISCDRKEPECSECINRNAKCIYNPSVRLVRNRSQPRYGQSSVGLIDQSKTKTKSSVDAYEGHGGHFMEDGNVSREEIYQEKSFPFETNHTLVLNEPPSFPGETRLQKMFLDYGKSGQEEQALHPVFSESTGSLGVHHTNVWPVIPASNE